MQNLRPFFNGIDRLSTTNYCIFSVLYNFGFQSVERLTLKKTVNQSGKTWGIAYVFIETFLNGNGVSPQTKLANLESGKRNKKMKENDECKELVSDCESLEDVLKEYKAAYNALSPEDKMEADVQRALKMINYVMSADPLPEEVHARFVAWFMQTGDDKHVEEAFGRYLDQNCVPIDPISDKAKKKLSGIWEVIGEREDAKKILA